MAGMGERLRSEWRMLAQRFRIGELAVLRLARRNVLYGFLPFCLMVIASWVASEFLAAVMVLGATPAMQTDLNIYRLIGLGLLALLAVGVVTGLIAGVYWSYRWLWIAVALATGKTREADRKEVELVSVIKAAKPPA